MRHARHLVLQLMPDFPDLAALNAWLEQRCIALWERTPHGTLPGTIAEVWALERTALMPTPPAFDGFVEQSKRVSPTCLINFERTATASRRRSPTARSACGSTPTGSWSRPRGRSSASIRG